MIGIVGLEREYGALLPRPKRVYESLAHEQADGDTNCDRNHRGADLDAVAISSDTSSLRETGLEEYIALETNDRERKQRDIPERGRVRRRP